MYSRKLNLSSIETVKKFVNLANRYDFPISVLSERYKVDAKSIMGIFSLDLTREVEMQIEEDIEIPQEFLDQLQEFAVPEK